MPSKFSADNSSISSSGSGIPKKYVFFGITPATAAAAAALAAAKAATSSTK